MFLTLKPDPGNAGVGSMFKLLNAFAGFPGRRYFFVPEPGGIGPDGRHLRRKGRKNVKKRTMLLLWIGASISITEIFTGGLLAPLGYAGGIAVILLGHLIGTGLLAFGGYISFSRKENAMDSVAFSLGKGGGRIVAFCNVVQLAGWTIVMVVQGSSAITGVFPGIPFAAAAFVLSALVLIWALIFGSPMGRLNEAAVAFLAVLCVLLFGEAAGLFGGAFAAGADGLSPPGSLMEGGMGFALGLELSIAMPVSWLPLAGDYARKAEGKFCAGWVPFIGYFAGSSLMYFFGLFISLRSGLDIFSFIASSALRFPACAVVVLSTLTTAFLDLYSAGVSSRQLVKTKREELPVLAIGVFAILVSIFFPVERYGDFLTSFLTAIGMVFVPVYTVLFLDFFLKRGRCEKVFNPGALVIVILGMGAYRVFTDLEIGIPTLISIILTGFLYMARHFLFVRSVKK
jgi:putative hydroxymethylpyrimidine transporter CytX